MKVSVIGATGRMGKELLSGITKNPRLELVHAVARKGSPIINQDVGQYLGQPKIDVKFSCNIEEAIQNSEVVIDFTSPELTMKVLKHTSKEGVAHIIGTTGLDYQQNNIIKTLSEETRIVYCANMSIGINIVEMIAEKIAQILPDYDAEILETHHRHKKDAPSGTAILLGKAVAKGRNADFEKHKNFSRSGTDLHRDKEEIGFSCVRAGDIIGDHSVLFAGHGEIIEIKHKAVSRDIYARGAMKAALWVAGKENGLYTMRDVLEF